jgi:hypothetical protein
MTLSSAHNAFVILHLPLMNGDTNEIDPFMTMHYDNANAICNCRINTDYKVIFYGHFMHLLGKPSLAWNPWNAIVQIGMPYCRAVLELSHLDYIPRFG